MAASTALVPVGPVNWTFIVEGSGLEQDLVDRFEKLDFGDGRRVQPMHDPIGFDVRKNGVFDDWVIVPVVSVPAPAKKSMYCRPERSVSQAPLAD